MQLHDLSIEDRELILAFIEIASNDCRHLHWNELEPTLVACWESARHGAPALGWLEVACHIRAACEETQRSGDDQPCGPPITGRITPLT